MASACQGYIGAPAKKDRRISAGLWMAETEIKRGYSAAFTSSVSCGALPMLSVR
jgi:hypothetical protein